MRAMKVVPALLAALVVGFAFGQPPETQDAPTLDDLHERRIAVYEELLELAYARGGNGLEERRKLFLVKIDAAKTAQERIAIAEERLKFCREYELVLHSTATDDIQSVLKAKAERIEAEILVNRLKQGEE